MKINLAEKLNDHIRRLENLSVEAEADSEESYSSRASAMSAMTVMLRELTKAQEEVINMERLMKIEKVTIEAVNKCLSSRKKEEFLTELETLLSSEEL